MPGNSVIRDKTNERHGLFWGIESCDVTHYSASTARRQHSESRYGTEQGSPRITLGSLCQELQHRCNVMVEIMHPVDHEVQSLYHFITESLSVGIDQLMQSLLGECQDFCVWGGYSRGSPTRLPFVFEMQYARPDAIAGAKVEGPARSAGGSSLAPAIARREAAGALAREV